MPVVLCLTVSAGELTGSDITTYLTINASLKARVLTGWLPASLKETRS